MPLDDLYEQLNAGVAGRYTIERELGRGGMAVVFLAHDTKLGRSVAIKVLRPELTSALGADRFLREIEMTARLSHPRIVTIHDSGAVGDLLYYVMPFVSGESLRARLDREGQLGIGDAIAIATSVASALTYAHTHGVVHRDIKPENILLTDGDALVADFGIGRALAMSGEAERLTQTGVMLGTPAYMSPEQCAGDQTLDGRSDIFSLGAVLYEMLVGEPPFRGPTMQALVARLSLEPMPSIRSVRPSVSVAVEDVTRKALEKVPADRFQSATAFSAALSHALTVPASTVSPRQTRSRRLVATVVAAIVLGGIGFASWVKLHGPPRNGIAVLGFDNHGSNPDDDYIGAGLADELTNILVKLPDTRVLALRSQKRGTAVSDSVGRMTGAKTLLRGDFQHVGNGVRVTVALVNAEDGVTISTDRYSQDALDVFALRDTVAQSVVDKLRLGLNQATSTAMRKRSTTNREAVEAYSHGRLLFRLRRGARDLERAVEDFRRAIQLDSNYAQAWSGLADGYSVLSAFGVFSPRDSFPRAKEFAQRALRLDSTLAEAHTSLALIEQIYEVDTPHAFAETSEALRLRPDDAEAHLFRAWSFFYDGRPTEAVDEAARARELDPFSVVTNLRLGWMLIFAKRLPEAERAIRFALDLDPQNGLGWTELGYVYMGRPGSCPQALEAADKIDDAFTISESGIKGYIYGKCGQAEKAQRLIATLEQASTQRFIFASRIASTFLGLGQKDSAFVWLDRAVDQRIPISASETVPDPYSALFAGDPRLAPLLRRRATNGR